MTLTAVNYSTTSNATVQALSDEEEDEEPEDNPPEANERGKWATL